MYNSHHTDSTSKDTSRFEAWNARTPYVFASFFPFLTTQPLSYAFCVQSSYQLSYSSKNKAKGSNIGDAIVELLLYGGMPASVIEARLVDGKKLELGAGCNQNKCVCNGSLSLRVPVFALTTECRLARSLQKLQRAGIVSKVIVGHVLIFLILINMSAFTGIRSAIKAQTRTRMCTPSLRYHFR